MPTDWQALSKLTLEYIFTWNAVDASDVSGCWLITELKCSGPYGQLYAFGQRLATHRAVYYVTTRDDPTGWSVLHTCGNKVCARPDHLYKGTNADNARDAVRLGELSRGESHGQRLKGKMASGDSNGSRTRPDRLVRGERWYEIHGMQPSARRLKKQAEHAE